VLATGFLDPAEWPVHPHFWVLALPLILRKRLLISSLLVSIINPSEWLRVSWT